MEGLKLTLVSVKKRPLIPLTRFNTDKVTPSLIGWAQTYNQSCRRSSFFSVNGVQRSEDIYVPDDVQQISDFKQFINVWYHKDGIKMIFNNIMIFLQDVRNLTA